VCAVATLNITGTSDAWPTRRAATVVPIAPGWVPAGWTVLLLLDAWNVCHRRPITEEEIAKELRASRG
jgi:hypothetical protein